MAEERQGSQHSAVSQAAQVVCVCGGDEDIYQRRTNRSNIFEEGESSGLDSIPGGFRVTALRTETGQPAVLAVLAIFQVDLFTKGPESPDPTLNYLLSKKGV